MKLASIILLYAFAAPALAGYAYPKPPSNWKPNPSGVGGLYQSQRSAMRDAANSNWYTTTGSVYLPGAGDIKYPLAFKEAANAANFLAKRTFVPLYLGSLAFDFLKSMASQSGLVFSEELGWHYPASATTAPLKFKTYYSNDWFTTLSQACAPVAASFCTLGGLSTAHSSIPNACQISCNVPNSDPYVTSLNLQSGCPPGWLQIPAGCVLTQPLKATPEQYEESLSPLKIPVELPPLLPFPLPVEDPRTNPKPFPFGDPDPFFVPTGDPYPAPQPRPDPDPNPYLEPGIQANPSPNPDTPFRLDLKPVLKPKPDTTPTPNPNPTPTPNPSPTPTPTPNPSPAPTPDKDPGLCALFPDILACEKLGEAPDAPELDNENKETPLTREDGFGASNGSCPPDKQITLSAGLVLKMPFTVICDFASKIRPLVLAFASLAAAFIFVGAMKNK